MKGVTSRQLEVMLKMGEIETGTGRFADLDQILDAVSWGPSKESLQFVLRSLISKGLLEKTARESRRGRVRVCFKATEKGLNALDPRRETGTDSVRSGVHGSSLKDFEVASEGSVSFVPGILEDEFSTFSTF